MKYIYTFVLSAFVLFAYAQVEDVSVGSGYANMSFYNIASGEVTSYSHDSWDIAFSVFGEAKGIFVNEAIASSMTQILPEVELYYSSDTDFTLADTANIIDRLYNEEISWEQGAFNRIADPLNPDDCGWGIVNQLTGDVEGSTIYFIKLRNDSYRKLKIESLENNTFTFTYANLDGSDQVTETINKSDFNGNKTLVYYSFGDQETKDLEPAIWDLLFTRYTDPIDDGTNLVEYMVTGVLSNRDRPIAVADDVDPGDVDFNDYLDDFETNVHSIGHDWKYFDLGAFQWVLVTDRVYFVQTDTETIWQLLFIDFSGSFSGITSLEKTLVFNTSVKDMNAMESIDMRLSPNPSNGFFNVNVETLTNFPQGMLRMINAEGKVIVEQHVVLEPGRNIIPIHAILSSGVYSVQLLTDNISLSQKLQVFE